MKNVKELMELGLSGRESKVYMSCLELGNDSVSEVAKLSGYPKSSTHELLKGLVKKGLVYTYVKKNRGYFAPASPENILGKLEKQETVAKKILPDLLSIYNSKHDRVKVSYYEGVEGLRNVLNQIVREADKMEAVVYVEEIMRLMKEHFEDFMNKRIDKGIPIRLIFRNTPNAWVRKKLEKKIIATMKITDSPIPFESSMILWRDKVAILSFRENFTITVIEGSLEINLFRAMFEMLWENIPEATTLGTDR